MLGFFKCSLLWSMDAPLIFLAILFQKLFERREGDQIKKHHIFGRYIEFLFFIQFWFVYFLWIHCVDGHSVECVLISSILYGFWDKFDRKGQLNYNFQNLQIFIREDNHPRVDNLWCSPRMKVITVWKIFYRFSIWLKIIHYFP